MNSLNKKLISGVVAATLVLSAGSVFAKKGGFDGQQADPSTRYEYIFTQLNLTAEQQAAVIEAMTTLRDSHQAEMEPAREAMRNSETRPSDEEREAKRDAQRATQKVALTDALNQVLSTTDTEKLVAYIDAHQGQGKQGMRGGNGQQGQKGEMRGQGQGQKGQKGGQNKGGKGPQGQRGAAAPAADSI